jgi:hypothetical protein
MDEKRGPRTIAPHFTFSMSKYSCYRERKNLSRYLKAKKCLSHSLVHTHTYIHKNNRTRNIFTITMVYTANCSHLTLHTALPHCLIRESAAPVSANVRLACRAATVWRKQERATGSPRHLPQLAASPASPRDHAIATLSEPHKTDEIPCLSCC